MLGKVYTECVHTYMDYTELFLSLKPVELCCKVFLSFFTCSFWSQQGNLTSYKNPHTPMGLFQFLLTFAKQIGKVVPAYYLQLRIIKEKHHYSQITWRRSFMHSFSLICVIVISFTAISGKSHCHVSSISVVLIGEFFWCQTKSYLAEGILPSQLDCLFYYW